MVSKWAQEEKRRRKAERAADRILDMAFTRVRCRSIDLPRDAERRC